MGTACAEAGPRRGCLPSLLHLVVLMTLIVGPSGFLVGVENGLLAEYFLSLTNAETCPGVNGSVDVLAGRVANFTRVDRAVNFFDRLSFGVKRCVWEKNNFGQLKYVCRAADEAIEYFAVRWTGYLYVKKQGMYTFKMNVDDGGRLMIGNAKCDTSATCGPWEQTVNMRLHDLDQTLQRDAYANYCPLCESGVYGDCWVSDNGCEPFRQWQLEMDGGLSGSCHKGEHVMEASRWLTPGMHPVRMEYFNRGGPAKFTLEYKGPDADTGGANGGYMSISPRNLIFPEFKGLRADWFEMPPDITRLPEQSALGTVHGGKFIRTVDDDFVDHAPGVGSFSQELFDMNKPIMIRWSGFMKITEPGAYIFQLICDDGGRLVMAGRGGERETILIDNDGIQDRARRTAVSKAMLAGLHGIRLDYFYRPGYSGAVPTPPGIELSYSGPDTGDMMRPVATAYNSVLQNNDATCELRNWRWGKGLSISRDCSGRCADTNEMVAGDGLCDEGRLQLGARTLDLNCAEYNYDNSDCEARVYDTPTTPRPQVQCYESPAAGGYYRNQVSSCPSGSLNSLCLKNNAPLCEPPSDQPDACSNLACCVAHIDGIPGWASDCIAFGTATNCTHQLAIMLDNMRQEPLDLFSKAYYEFPLNPAPEKTAYLMKDCDEPRCNSIPTEMVVNPRTGLDTNEPVCPVGEAPTGITCFEGPWGVTPVRVPRDDCEGGPQNGKYQWNFCKNKRTIEGQPFVRCCAFAYLNALGKGECRFTGLPYGTCDRYIEEFQKSSSRSQWTRISNPSVLNDCKEDDCNDPMDSQKGCPAKVNKAPPQTMDTNTPPPGFINHTAMLEGAKEAEGDGPPWLVIGLIAGCLFGLVLAAVVTNHLLKEPPFSPWYSNKAHIVSDDTWIEPEQDDEAGMQFGVIKPRPIAFNMIVKQQKAEDGHSFKPKALEDGGAVSKALSPEAEDHLRTLALADAGSSPNQVSFSINSRQSTKMSRMSQLSLASTAHHRASTLSSAPRRSIMSSASGFGTSIADSEAGDGALALEDVQEEEGSVDTEAYDGIHHPHMVEVILNQRNAASLSRPAAADRNNRYGVNGRPMVQTICT